MCELFGISARHLLAGGDLPLAEFRLRGGATADNPDGWGLAWRAAGKLRLEKAPDSGCGSVHFNDLIDGLFSDLIIAHVRKARFPPVNTLANTHPFLRDCCGRRWAFAHNGLVPDVVALEAENAGRVCAPEGETDSEFAFCHLLSHASRHFGQQTKAGWPVRLGLAAEAIAGHGKFNFLLSDGVHLIAYGHDRLHYRESADAVLVATEPLGDRAGWTAFAPGELCIWRDGRRVESIATHPPLPHLDNTP